jgi:hypothetical protein
MGKTERELAEREAFETYAFSLGYKSGRDNEGNGYRLAPTQELWLAWQARAALTPTTHPIMLQSWIENGKLTTKLLTADEVYKEPAPAALQAVEPEPVAGMLGTDQWVYFSKENAINDARVFKQEIVPLYTHPAPAKPLSESELFRLLHGVDGHSKRLPQGFLQFARAIEAAHGIKETS